VPYNLANGERSPRFLRSLRLRTLAPLLFFGVLPLALPAQPVVSPPGMANAHGGVRAALPWGSSHSELLYQQVHDDLLGRHLQIEGMGFRHDWNTTHVARRYTATLTMGEAMAGATETSRFFHRNWFAGGSKTIVLQGTITFPALKAYAAPPAPLDALVLFSSPFAHTGSHPLIWQVQITATSGSTPIQYFESGPGDTHLPGVLGTGCPMSGQTAPLTSTGGTTTTILAERLWNGPATGQALLLLGDESPRWWGNKLPLRMDFAGSPTCFLQLNVVAMVPPTTTWLFAYPYRWIPELAGVRLRTQWVVQDKGLPRTSNGLDHSFPYSSGTASAWPQARVWAGGFGNTPPAEGIVEATGLVTGFLQ